MGVVNASPRKFSWNLWKTGAPHIDPVPGLGCRVRVAFTEALSRELYQKTGSPEFSTFNSFANSSDF